MHYLTYFVLLEMVLGSSAISGIAISEVRAQEKVSAQKSVPLASPLQASEPVLTIQFSGKTLRFTRSELLSSPDVKTIVVEQDPSYQYQKMSYQAVPVSKLFQKLDLSEGEIIQYQCLDGFSASFPKERLLNTSSEKSIAYLAIEPKKKWPVLPKQGRGKTPGPFYLVWLNPKASQINREEWPFQVVEFQLKKSFRAIYPKIFPASQEKDQRHPAAEFSSVERGFQVFTQVCFGCHRMNHQGESQIGPDLNLPMNPTEYFKEEVLRKFIRNPKNVRDWPNSLMPPFQEEVVSNSELDDLISYLKHMSTRKQE